MNKKWQIYQTNEEQIEELKSKYGLNELLATILSNRNITEEEQIRLFLNPTRNDFYDPYLITDMEIAVERIIKAIENKEKVTIYGDYDVDGITSITVLKSFLKEIGLETSVYIPNRLDEGYGLNKNAIDKIAKDGCNLMITVDCGISGIEEIEYANSLGIETIVTDHHEPGNELPNAVAVIDNKRKDSKYPFRELAGVGVVFKLTQALAKRLELKEETYLKYLDIVCVGTISDIVPLVDENRVIAKLGLMLVKQTKNIGLKSIINSSGYTKIDSNTISFGVAPRINACGRMGFAEDALKLFITEDLEEIQNLTKKLNGYNKERQDTEKRIMGEALKEIEENKENDKNIIVLSNKGWHHGVIGIVSSKITDMYLKPSILLCEEDGICKGSGRSVAGLDLHEILNFVSEDLEKYGGHAMAVGVTLKKEKLEKFKEDINNYIDKLGLEEINPVLNIDMEVSLRDISKEAIKELKKLEPFGEANEMPLFVIKNLRIESIRAITEGQHLKLRLKDENFELDAIGFHLGEYADNYRLGDKVDIVGNLDINSYNGIERMQITLKDMIKSL